MNTTVLPHETVAARPHPGPQARPGWSAFFQSLDQVGQSLAQAAPDHVPPVTLIPISRFATSA